MIIKSIGVEPDTPTPTFCYTVEYLLYFLHSIDLSSLCFLTQTSNSCLSLNQMMQSAYQSICLLQTISNNQKGKQTNKQQQNTLLSEFIKAEVFVFFFTFMA